MQETAKWPEMIGSLSIMGEAEVSPVKGITSRVGFQQGGWLVPFLSRTEGRLSPLPLIQGL